MKLTQEAYDKLINDVEQELSALLVKAEAEVSQPLVKSEEEPKAEEAKEEQKDDEKEEKEEAKEEEKPESKEEAKEESKEEHEDDKHNYDEEDLEEMHKMYHSMSKGELKAHKEAMEKCWMAKCGDMQSMAKSEEKVETLQPAGNKEAELLKSEVTSLKEENSELKKSVESLVTAMNDFLTKKAPARKAVTDLSFIEKSEKVEQKREFSKSEITNILTKKTMDPNLSKSDRELINNYYINNAGVETISHLLK